MYKYLLSLLAVFMLILPAQATTISWDGHFLACDSQSTTGGGTKTRIKTKIHYSSKRHAWIGIAGAVAFQDDILKWFMNSTSPTYNGVASKESGLIYEFILVQKSGDVLIQGSFNGIIQKSEPVGPIAIGSGEDFARTALFLGLDARQSVLVASQFDSYTDQHVEYFDITEDGSLHHFGAQ